MSSPQPQPSRTRAGVPGGPSNKSALFPRSRTLFAATLLALLFFAPASLARAVRQERVLRFHSEVRINVDTSLSIRETIKIYAAGNKIKRGIIREFPAWFTDDYNYKIYVHYLDMVVKRDGKKEPYSLQREENTYRLYIGRPDSELPAGEHTYEISYTVLRKLQYFDTYDLLVWNVTGASWGMPVQAVTATVSLPRLTRPIQRYSATINGQGSEGVDFSVAFPEKGRAVFTLLRPLAPDEDFSIAVAWRKGVVREPTAMEYYNNQ